MQVVRPVPAVEELSRRIVAAMGLRGALLGVEWKYDRRDGEWKFLEVNARSMLAISVAKFAGADMIDRLWRDKLGLPQPPEGRVRYGRKWAYVKNGLLLFRKHPEERKSLLEYLRLYKPPICFGLWDACDPRPALYDIAPLLTRRLAKTSDE
jgi:predicted ATP-grasp superfamily ATP-dependent carboligase